MYSKNRSPVGFPSPEELIGDPVVGGGDSISVTIRFRPLSEREIVRNEYNPVTSYVFDRVFGPSVVTQEVYEVVARPVVKSAMEGVNGTVFAYGVTSSEKTHMMHVSSSCSVWLCLYSTTGILLVASVFWFKGWRPCPLLVHVGILPLHFHPQLSLLVIPVDFLRWTITLITGITSAASVSPTRPTKKAMSPPRRVSPPKKVSVTPLKRVSPPKKVSTAANLKRSFSPSRLASRLVSPLKSRKSSVQRSSMDGGNGGSAMMMNMMSELKQRPMSTTTSMNMSARRV